MRIHPIAATLVAATLAAGCTDRIVAPPTLPASTVALDFGDACSFTTSGTVMTLDDDCTTSAPIVIPDGFTLDGAGHTIQGVDPAGDHFRGAVVTNGGATAHVTRLSVTVSGLANACDGGDDRLRGIMFEGASGSITHFNVFGVNQGASGCQEGNSVEIRNDPFDGTHPNTQTVVISHGSIVDWQKTGIVCNGDVSCTIQHVNIGPSATQANLAANSVQFGFGATGLAAFNRIAGNQWCGGSNFVATAVLLFETQGVTLFNNAINGNSDVGIYSYGTGDVLNNNRLDDDGPDCSQFGYDYGIGNWGVDGVVTNNKVGRGFDTPYDGVEGGRNKLLPGSSVGMPFFK